MADVFSRRRKRGSATSDHEKAPHPDSRAVFMASVFSKRRKASNPNSVDEKALKQGSASSLDEKAPHPSSGVDEVPTIFLSHSGTQKPFVENLYNALQNANHTSFFDKHSLPKGSPFPPHIIRAVEGCKLGVVVLSKKFLTSKWPMLELEMLISQQRAKVLPLFYELRPEDLKSPENLKKWRRVWTKKADLDADKCEQAVIRVSSFNGEIYSQGTSEITFIRKVVGHICTLLLSHVSHDLSPYKGHQRLAQEVARHFEEALARQGDKACMVGLYGVGGLGKTTMCKIMCEFYMSMYLGKSCHIEFPSDGDHKMILQECKKALKKLTNLSDEHVLNKADDIDQVIQLMKDNLAGPTNEVFLAIDNVWESSLEAAKRILDQVNFSINSKILLTSRSHQVLKDLDIRGDSNITVAPLPSPDHDEAFQIFQDTFGRARPLKSLVLNTNLLDSVLRRCFFSDKYHPLALKAVGRYVQRVCDLEDLNKIEDILARVLKEVIPQNDVEDLIRLNYKCLEAEKQHMFLDIVVVLLMEDKVKEEDTFKGEVAYEEAHQWLSILYKKNSSSRITSLIYELALDGLIQIERRAEKRMIRVHDLYYDLAQKEAARSARFFQGKSPEPVEWERLERVIIGSKAGRFNDFMEELQQHQCPKLQVFIFYRYFSSGIYDIQLDLIYMPSLCVLRISRGKYLRSIKNWSAATGLAIVYLKYVYCDPPLEPIPSIPCLEELILDHVHMEEGLIFNLAEHQRLKKLVLLNTYYSSREGFKVLNVNNAKLVNLQLLRIGGWESIERIEGLDALKNLEYIEICDNANLEYIEVVEGLSPALKHVAVARCEALKRMPDLSGLTCSERLELRGNKSMEEVVGGLSPALKHVHVRGCEALKRIPDLSGLTCLEGLELWDNKSMEEVVGGLSPALKRVEVISCQSLKRMPDLSGLTCLESLDLSDNKSMEEVVGGLSPALKRVEVTSCQSLKRMPDLSGLTCLEGLVLRDNKSMEEVGGENLSSTLRHLTIVGCGSLRRCPSLKESVHLRYLQASAMNIGGSLQRVSNLQELHLVEGGRTLVLSGVTSTLQRLTIQGYDSLLKLDVECLLPCKSLKHLQVEECWALEEIGDLSALLSLERLRIASCPSLKKLGGNLCVQRLWLQDCESLEDIPDVSLITSSISRCGKLPSRHDPVISSTQFTHQ